MGKTIHIYHHGDMDGITAGACIYHLMDVEGYYNKECHVINNYAQLLDFSCIEKEDIIFFVDYSFTNKENIKRLGDLMDDLYKDDTQFDTSKYIYWIDHHGSSLKYMNDHPLDKVTKIIDTSVCGALLAYKFCYIGNTYFDDRVLLSSTDLYFQFLTVYRGYKLNDEVEHNRFIAYVNSWDIWKHDRPQDQEFMLGFMSTFSDPYDYRFKYLTDTKKSHEMVELLINEGIPILNYLTVMNESQVNEMGYEFTLNGYNCIMYNGRGNSTTFGDLIDKYDICAMFYFTGEKYIYSLYSKKINTAKISEAFGGGGHPGASGFQSEDLLFKKGAVFNIKTE